MSDRLEVPSEANDPVARANAFLTEVRDTQYVDWLHEDLELLIKAYAVFRASPTTETVLPLAKAFQTLQDLGATFDYPLISDIGILAVRFLEAGLPRDSKQQEVVRILFEALELVVTQKMRGDGGEVGQGLIRGLQAAIAKVRG